MGHLAGKDTYRKLGKKIDGLTCRAPWNDTLYKILKELYTSEEAEFIIKMPYSLASLDQQILYLKISRMVHVLEVPESNQK